MKILIVGSGAIGVALGATLISSGNNVSFFARGETLQAIRKDGVHRTGLFGAADAQADSIDCVSDCYSDFPSNYFDYILITTKSMANHEVSEALQKDRRILAPNGKLVIMQNGWGNDAPYLRYFAKTQVCSARVITGFQRTAPNVSHITVHTAPILLGNLYGVDTSPLQPLADAIVRGGIPSEVTDSVDKALWAKMLYNCALNPLGAVLGVHYGALTECEQSVQIMNDIIDEIFSVMHAAGCSTYWDTAQAYRSEFYGKLVPDTYRHNSSTLQDIRKKQRTEIDTLTGKILELGEQYGVCVPANRMLYRLIKSLEANY